MAKPNVHTASRDELVEVGVRAELADEILKRRRKGAIHLEALEEVPGVGPATLEQLRKALDFREQPRKEDDGGERNGKDATDRAMETSSRTADQVAEVGKRTADQAVEVGKRAADQVSEVSARTLNQVTEVGIRAADQAAGVTRELTKRTGDTVQQGLQVIQDTAGTVRELPREVARRSTEGTADIGRTLLSLAHEQTRQNLDILTALTAAVDWNKATVDWDRVVQLQGELLRGSLDRSAQFSQRYLEVTQAVVTAIASASQEQARKAA